MEELVEASVQYVCLPMRVDFERFSILRYSMWVFACDRKMCVNFGNFKTLLAIERNRYVTESFDEDKNHVEKFC